MARTIAEVQSELEELRRAHATGARRVSYEGRTVEYDSAAGLLTRIEHLKAELEELGSGAVRRRSVAALASFRRAGPD